MESVAVGRLAPGLRGLRRTEVLALGGCITLFVVARLAGNVVRGVPGHTGALWLPPLFFSLALVRRVGAPTITALVGSSVVGAVGNQGLLALPSDVCAGLALDALGWGVDRLSRLPWALLAGAAAHLAKFAVHTVLATVAGYSGGSGRFGVLTVLGLHAAFGLVGGLLGWAGLRGIRKATHATAPNASAANSS
jgi:hypothetical protein